MTMDVTLIFAGVVFLAAFIIGMLYRCFINSCRGRIANLNYILGIGFIRFGCIAGIIGIVFRDQMCYLIR
jgi:uncharacterized membrane protein